MNKKRIIFALFMLLLTVFVVLFPAIVNSVSANSRLNNKIYGEYQAAEGKITSAQVAKMFYNNEFVSASSSSQKYSDERLCGSAKSLLKTIFSDNEELYNYYGAFCENPPVYYAVDSYLTVIENRPVALNFVVMEFTLDTRYLQLFFEEKTNTLLYFQHDIPQGIESEDINQENRYVTDFTLSELRNYYETELGLSSEKHACSVVTDEVISFGLLQYSEEPIIEID